MLSVASFSKSPKPSRRSSPPPPSITSAPLPPRSRSSHRRPRAHRRRSTRSDFFDLQEVVAAITGCGVRHQARLADTAAGDAEYVRGVDPVLTDERVVAGSAVENVVVLAAIDRVRTIAAEDLIGAHPAIDDVVAIISTDHA